MSAEGEIHLEKLGDEQDKGTYLKIVKYKLKETQINSLIDSEFTEEISEDLAIKTAIAKSKAIANALCKRDFKEAIAESEVIAESLAMADDLYENDLEKAIVNSLNDLYTSLYEDPDYPSDEEESQEVSTNTSIDEELPIDLSSIANSKEIVKELNDSTTSLFEHFSFPYDESQSGESHDFTTSSMADPGYPSDESLSWESLDSNEEIIDKEYSSDKSLSEESLEPSKKRRTSFLNKFNNLFKKREKSNLNQRQVPQKIIGSNPEDQLSIIIEGHNEDESMLRSPQEITAQRKKEPLYRKLRNLTTRQKSVTQKANRLKGKKKGKKERSRERDGQNLIRM